MPQYRLQRNSPNSVSSYFLYTTIVFLSSCIQLFFLHKKMSWIKAKYFYFCFILCSESVLICLNAFGCASLLAEEFCVECRNGNLLCALYVTAVPLCLCWTFSKAFSCPWEHSETLHPDFMFAWSSHQVTMFFVMTLQNILVYSYKCLQLYSVTCVYFHDCTCCPQSIQKDYCKTFCSNMLNLWFAWKSGVNKPVSSWNLWDELSEKQCYDATISSKHH